MLLENKVVLVTGSTTGIGAAIARRALAEGAQVMVHGLEEELARAVCADLGEGSHYVIADLAAVESCEDVVEATVAHFGRLDGVVNNAAVMTRSDIDTTDAETFDRTIAVDLRAPLLVTRRAVQIFRRQANDGQPGGVVLNIGSINGLSGEPNQLAYSIAKGGLITMTRNLANALATERIRVNQLSLGWVTSENELIRKQNEGLAPGWEKNVPAVYAPTGRLLTPEEVAAHAVFWLSDQSAPANGVVYELDQYSLIGRNAAKDF